MPSSSFRPPKEQEMKPPDTVCELPCYSTSTLDSRENPSVAMRHVISPAPYGQSYPLYLRGTVPAVVRPASTRAPIVSPVFHAIAAVSSHIGREARCRTHGHCPLKSFIAFRNSILRLLRRPAPCISEYDCPCQGGGICTSQAPDWFERAQSLWRAEHVWTPRLGGFGGTRDLPVPETN